MTFAMMTVDRVEASVCLVGLLLVIISCVCVAVPVHPFSVCSPVKLTVYKSSVKLSQILKLRMMHEFERSGREQSKWLTSL